MPETQTITSEHVTAAHSAPARKQQVVQAAIQQNLFSDAQPLAAFVDVAGVAETIATLKNSFPKHFEHTFAAKANTMRAALELVRQEGLGCEVASRGELRQALRAGFEPRQIVYDEPAKTPTVLREALDAGVNLNIDNFQEFATVEAHIGDSTPTARLGFRINPQVGVGAIGAMSTATATSKFGVALSDDGQRERLIELYSSRPWLNSIHTHIGSQGCTLALMVSGIRRVVDLVEEINAQFEQPRIRVIDIGGGLPVNFDGDEVKPSFADYAAVLKKDVPELFDGRYTVKTEFGRSIFAKNGYIVSRVEYVKQSGGRRIAITHAGAQTAARTTFMPDSWALRIGVYDAQGNERDGAAVEQDVAGPCCFAGDVIAHQRPLPAIQAGDHVLLHDTGAYYFSNPYFYNSLPAVAVYAIDVRHAGVTFEQWRQQQSLDDLLATIG